MSERPAHLLDYRFRQLKRLADGGGGREGHYARGVRSVVAQIEVTGHFRPNPLLAYLVDLHVLPHLADAPHDAAGFAAARALLAEVGWTAEEGYDFAQGARLAERELSDYRAPEADTRSAA